MPGARIDGVALGAVAAGSLLLYAGIKGYSIPVALQAIIQGKAPSAGQTNPPKYAITDTSAASSSSSSTGSQATVSGGSAQAILQKTASRFGWGSGQEWQSLQSVEMAEAGFSTTARNPTSGAFGLAQALGHGNSNTAAPDGTNEYGGFGLSDAQARAANSGDAGAQALWMCNYIAATYGDPNAAWAHEQANHWY